MGHDHANSILTSNHRKFLAGDVEYTWDDSRGRPTRSRIRARILAGLSDFSYLADPERLDERDAAQLAEEPIDDDLAEMVAFAYRLAPMSIDTIVETGIRRGVERFHPGYTVDRVEIIISQRHQALNEAQDKLDRGEPLTDREVRLLLELGELPAEELRQYLQDHPSPDVDRWARRYR